MVKAHPMRLSVLASASGFTLWLYKSEHDRKDVLSPDFFSKCRERFSAGDMVIVRPTAPEVGFIGEIELNPPAVILRLVKF